MATKAKSAGASALAEVVTGDASAALVDEVATAELAPGAGAAPVWPRVVTLRNHSGMQLVEPISSQFLFPYNSVTVELHSQEQADAVADNLRTLAEVNGLGNALTIEGLPG
jgi:hypothetical protein